MWDVIHVVNLCVTQNNRGSGVLKHLNCCAHKELPRAGVAAETFVQGWLRQELVAKGGQGCIQPGPACVGDDAHKLTRREKQWPCHGNPWVCFGKETREGTMIFSSSASNFLSRQTSDVFKEVVSLLPSLQNPLPCYFFLLGLCMCGTVLCNGINSPPHNWAVCALLHGDW